MGSLSEKQRRFVNEYLVDLNATKAAKRAGYSRASARSIGAENLTKPDIQEYLQSEFRKRSSRLQITQDLVIQGLIDNIERASQAVPVRNHKGEVFGEYRYQANAINKAYELLGKHLGMFTGRQSIPPEDVSINVHFVKPNGTEID